MHYLTIQQFFEMPVRLPLLDVRSPGEYAQGHVPSAKNLPLFSDEERAVVGTLYKQQGPEPAMLRGLEFAGQKMASYVQQARQLVPGRQVAVHCWRGGKRSASIATLLEFLGYEVQVVTGTVDTDAGEFTFAAPHFSGFQAVSPRPRPLRGGFIELEIGGRVEPALDAPPGRWLRFRSSDQLGSPCHQCKCSPKPV